MKILILVLSMNDNDIYTEFYKTQKDTWDSIEIDGITTYYYFGNNSDDIISENNILTSVKENILNCGYKTLKAFELIKDMEFDYIFRTNSSSYVDKLLLQNYLKDKPKINYYSGCIGVYDNITFASGSGYVLSKNLINLILTNSEKWNHNFIDDVSLGLLLKDFNINPETSFRYDVSSKDNIDEIPNNYFHYRLKNENNRNYDINLLKYIYKNKYEKN